MEIVAAKGTDLVACTPLPAWVEPFPLNSDATEADNAAIGAGIHRLLYEAQPTLPNPNWPGIFARFGAC